ncbi:hypothetical protein DSM43518_00134 [Mycobacterium marinum]|uniref:hypothetical protein n=1 Tax=Mycobacterium marinum TaxID=1781 RepID=UPI0003588D7D|nr:hypothetical protein [Mycobacterium marinum]AXN47388.1 hypothetical protein MM1218R_05490 [Mycobacterium marinum]AXN52823.1 hypothetical protein CCUG20998_05454 [Mycobacterium marinum]EPQ72227.1 hypothetical protein MMEU_3609 [Mycobacterium marinum str. Europe]RFZ01417.1 hypothetical protein DE4381_05438 [Mycobacterium marinum]RFZ11381.1 hypothetical protein VIMS_03294 [Mycobacterium marinum]
MAEPLAVDPARLIAAGSKLAELVFPAPPAPIAATGGDPVSAAINDTMPGIESLVSDGMPGVTAALKRTASSMSTAADIYAKADQALGDALTQYQFGGDGQALGASGANAVAQSQTVQSLAAPAAGLLGAPVAQALAAPATGLLGAPAAAATQIGEAVSAQAEALSPRVAATIPQLVQLAPQAGQMAQQASPIAQTISQSAQQGSSQGGAAPAQLVSDTKPDEDAELADETKEGEEDAAAAAGAEGAAAGHATLVSAPVESTGGGETSTGSVSAPI